LRTGIVGHRSWISQEIIRKLEDTGNEVVLLEKKFVAWEDLSGLDVVYLIAGRARPSEQQRLDEVSLVKTIMDNPRSPGKMIYISSLAVERSGEGDLEPYAVMKMTCESLIREKSWGYVLRPPVIFGQGQSPWADMLLPAIARANFGLEPLIVKQPTKPFYIMSVDDVAHAAFKMGNGYIEEHTVSLYSDPITPMELIHIVSPGLEFIVPDGWRNEWPLPPTRAPMSDSTYYRWYYSKNRLRSSFEAMVNHIIRECVESAGHEAADLPDRVKRMLSKGLVQEGSST
jgi:nucleoside-diphosphate-sugar epimerase